jgi:uncharacterized protein DUF3455
VIRTPCSQPQPSKESHEAPRPLPRPAGGRNRRRRRRRRPAAGPGRPRRTPAPTVPQQIAVPEGHKPCLVGHAVGVQIYRCNATADGYRWGFVGPRAELYGDNGKPITTHFAGPRWQTSDGSVALGAFVRGASVD